MAKRTGMVNLADLTGAIGVHSPVDGVKVAPSVAEPVAATPIPAADIVVEQGSDGVFLANVALDEIAPNPRNPRRRMGNLDDLETIVDHQLQPGTASTRAAWLKVFPADAEVIGEAKYVLINGHRRLAASHEYGRPGLDIVIRDSLVESEATVLAAAVLENLAREDLDVIEEAEAVEQLVQTMPSAAAAAKILKRTPAWVSQRRALLLLDPQLQEKLREGELGIREARALARVPREEQVEAWLAEQERQNNPEPESEPTPEPEPKAKEKDDDTDDEESGPVGKIVRALKGAKADPETVVAALEEFFDPVEMAQFAGLIK